MSLFKSVVVLAGLLVSTTVLSTEHQSIIGGQATSINNWQSAAALVYSTEFSHSSAYQRQFCGGNVISDRWILTAAHCLYVDKASNGSLVGLAEQEVSIILGVGDLSQQADELQVSAIHIHPGYEKGNPGSPNDIALIKLAKATNYPTMALYMDNPVENTGAVVIGWGATRYDAFNAEADPTSYPEVLREVTVPIVSNQTCNNTPAYDGFIVQSQLCAGLKNGGKDSCSGDSGGPLMIKQAGEYKQVGVVSFGAGCAVAEAYGVYTRVSSFSGWIGNYVEGIEGSGTSSGSSSSGGGTLLWVIMMLGLFGVMTKHPKRKEV